MQETRAISLRNLRKEYESFVLDIPELDVYKGYITGFIGKNGAGKTTTLKLIMNLIFPNSGTIEVLGQNMLEEGAEIRKDIAFISDEAGFTDNLTLNDIRKQVAPFYPSWDDGTYRKYLKKFQLDPGKKFQEYSAGMRKKLCLLVALAHKPRLLIMDEPTSNLDPIMRNEILDIFSELLQDGETTIFFSTHITSDLEKCADYIVMMDGGKVIINERRDLLFEKACVVKGGNELLTKETSGIFHGVKQGRFGFEAYCTDREKAYAVFGDEVVYDKPSLEDLMLFVDADRDE